MNKTIAFLAALTFLTTFAASVFAFEGDINTTITAVYWDGKLDFGSDRTSNRHLPSLSAQIDFNKSWKANFEYTDSMSSTTEPNGYTFDNRLLLAGMQYMFTEDLFVTCSWRRVDYNLAGALMPYGIDFSGVRLGGGYYFSKYLAEDWTGLVEFGVGVTNNANVAYTTGTVKQDADSVDGKIEARYRFFEHYSAVGGYRYVKTRTNVGTIPYSFDVKGPFLGIGYEF